jgi:hypothetical protein
MNSFPFLLSLRGVVRAVVVVFAAAGVSGFPACDAISVQAKEGIARAGFLAARYSTMTEAERTENFNKYVAPLSAEARNAALDFLLGSTAMYISPEQEAAMFKDELSFMWSVGALAMNSGYGLINPGTDPFLLALKDFGAYVPAQLKEISGPFVDARLALLKKRFGMYYGGMDTADFRRILWDDAQFEKVMTDDKAAYDEVMGSWYLVDEGLLPQEIEAMNKFFNQPVAAPPS